MLALLLPRYGQSFSKNFAKFFFGGVAIFLDSYFHGFWVELLNPQESIREKTYLATIHLQEWIFTYQDDFEINVLVSVIFKISRECNLTDESQIQDIHENGFQSLLRSLHKNWQQIRFPLTGKISSGKIFLTLPKFRHLSPTKIFTLIWNR